jgi:hypothetical protein
VGYAEECYLSDHSDQLSLSLSLSLSQSASLMIFKLKTEL